MNQYEILYLDKKDLFHTVTVLANTMAYAVFFLEKHFDATRILRVKKLTFWDKLFRFLKGSEVSIINSDEDEWQ
jgi:hypothetical protein